MFIISLFACLIKNIKIERNRNRKKQLQEVLYNLMSVSSAPLSRVHKFRTLDNHPAVSNFMAIGGMVLISESKFPFSTDLS